MLPEPKANPDLLGHELAEAEILRAVASGRLHHGWLITGAPGIGKATLGYRFARYLLNGGKPPSGSEAAGQTNQGASLAVPVESQSFRRMVAGGHADFVDVAPNEKGNLSIEEVRRIEPLFRRTAAEGGWRIVLIDNADAMTVQAQNAVLKILEEPPAGALIILTASAPGRLLPTIRSRVRMLALEPLKPAILETLLEKSLPALTASERAQLAGLAQGSLGQAIALHEAEGLLVYRELLALLGNMQQIPAKPLLDYAEKLGRKGGEPAYGVISRLFPEWLADVARMAATGQMNEKVEGEGQVAAKFAQSLGLERSLALWEKVSDLFTQAEGLYLDRKQTLLSALLAVKGAAA